MEYTALIKRSGDWWIGWIEEVPGVNCQERTRGTGKSAKSWREKSVGIFESTP